jgi:hypothetical protein
MRVHESTRVHLWIAVCATFDVFAAVRCSLLASRREPEEIGVESESLSRLLCLLMERHQSEPSGSKGCLFMAKSSPPLQIGDDVYLNIRELAILLRISVRQLAEWRRLRKIPPAVYLGRKPYWRQETIRQFMAGEIGATRLGRPRKSEARARA